MNKELFIRDLLPVLYLNILYSCKTIYQLILIIFNNEFNHNVFKKRYAKMHKIIFKNFYIQSSKSLLNINYYISLLTTINIFIQIMRTAHI